MTQKSGPLVGANFTDDLWRTAVGRQGIVLDYAGTAYGLTLPPSSNDVVFGPGKSVVAGFAHEIPTGETESLTVPESSDGTVGRTDILGVAYDPTYTEEPGPCRLIRVEGTEGSADRPTVDMAPPGAEVMPLYAITRRQGQALSQATVVDLRRWTGPSMVAPTSVSPIGDVPVGTTMLRGSTLWARRMTGPLGSPEWFSADFSQLDRLNEVTNTPWGSSPINTNGLSGTRRYRIRNGWAALQFQGQATSNRNGADVIAMTFGNTAYHPQEAVYGVAWVGGQAQRAYVTTSGDVHFHPATWTNGTTIQAYITWPVA